MRNLIFVLILFFSFYLYADTLDAVEINRDIEIGQGIDFLKGVTRGIAIKPGNDIGSISGSEGQEVTFEYDYIESIKDLYKRLDVSVTGQYKAMFAQGDAKTKYAKSQSVNAYSLFVFVRVTVRNPLKRLKGRVYLSEEAYNLLKKQNGKERFRKRFGDRFVSGLVTGGEFCCVLTVEMKDESTAESLKSSISAKTGSFSISGEIEKAVQELSQKSTVKMQCFMQGGVGLKIPDTPKEIVNFAREFANKVKGDDSFLYQVVLRDYETLELPDEANIVDITQKRDTLTRCSELYVEYEDKESDIDFILANESQFDNVDRVYLRHLQEEYTRARNEVRKIASDCINNPLDACKIPIKFVPEKSLPRRKISYLEGKIMTCEGKKNAYVVPLLKTGIPVSLRYDNPIWDHLAYEMVRVSPEVYNSIRYGATIEEGATVIHLFDEDNSAVEGTQPDALLLDDNRKWLLPRAIYVIENKCVLRNVNEREYAGYESAAHLRWYD